MAFISSGYNPEKPMENRITDIGQTISLDTSIEGKFFVLRKGKKNYHLVQVTG